MENRAGRILLALLASAVILALIFTSIQGP
jgi:hypothetical protein